MNNTSYLICEIDQDILSFLFYNDFRDVTYEHIDYNQELILIYPYDKTYKMLSQVQTKSLNTFNKIILMDPASNVLIQLRKIFYPEYFIGE